MSPLLDKRRWIVELMQIVVLFAVKFVYDFRPQWSLIKVIKVCNVFDFGVNILLQKSVIIV